MHDHTPHPTPPSGNEFNFRDRPEIDVAISATAKELRQAGRLHEALSLLEERIVESFSAKEVDPLVVFQAAKIHAQLSTEPHDSHHSRAQAYLKRLVRDNPHNSFATQLLGDLYEREGDLKKAATCYILAARNDSNPIPALGKLCGTFLALEQRQLARKAADWMLSLDGDNQMSLTLKVRVELANGDVVAARDAVNKLHLQPRVESSMAVLISQLFRSLFVTHRNFAATNSAPRKT